MLFVSQNVGTPAAHFPAAVFQFFILNGDFWDPGGAPWKSGLAQKRTKKSIHPFFGAPGRNPRAEKMINWPDGQGALKKSVFC